jgi:hypothetical protein
MIDNSNNTIDSSESVKKPSDNSTFLSEFFSEIEEISKESLEEIKKLFE